MNTVEYRSLARHGHNYDIEQLVQCRCQDETTMRCERTYNSTQLKLNGPAGPTGCLVSNITATLMILILHKRSELKRGEVVRIENYSRAGTCLRSLM